MKPAWQRAHERLMATLPVRTHVRKEPPARPAGPVLNPRSWRRNEIRRMLAEGLDIHAMAKRLKVTTTAVRYHLDAIEQEAAA